MDPELEEPIVDPRSMSVKELVIRLDGKVSSAVSTLSAGQTSLRSDVDDHESRLRVLEARPVITWKSLAGTIGGVGATLTLLVTFFSHVNIH